MSATITTGNSSPFEECIVITFMLSAEDRGAAFMLLPAHFMRAKKAFNCSSPVPVNASCFSLRTAASFAPPSAAYLAASPVSESILSISAAAPSMSESLRYAFIFAKNAPALAAMSSRMYL